jgi:hypothetical protein
MLGGGCRVEEKNDENKVEGADGGSALAPGAQCSTETSNAGGALEGWRRGNVNAWKRGSVEGRMIEASSPP